MSDRRDPARARLIYVSLITVCALLALWIGFATLLVPPIIESSYRGQSLYVFNRMIRGQATFPVEHYLQIWDAAVTRITKALMAFGLIGVIMFAITSSRSFFQRYVGPATPGALGAIRMVTCLVLLLTTALEELPSIALLPPEARAPHGLMSFVYALPIGFQRLVGSERGLWMFQLVTEVTFFLGALGWRSRIVIPLGTVCHFLLGGILRDYSYDWHQGWVPLYLMVVLSFTPCGDGWSVDRLRRVFRGLPVPAADRESAVYGWSRYMCWVVIALPYVESGVSKLRHGGLSWWSASNMRYVLQAETLRPREFDWQLSLYLTSAPDFVFNLLGLVTVVGEVAFVLVLVSRRARHILPIAMVAMHTGILLLQRIFFLDLILLQSIFFDWRAIRKRVGRWLAVERGTVRGATWLGTTRNRYARSENSPSAAGGVPPAPGHSAEAIRSPHRFRFPAALSGWALVAMLCWFYRIEYYPLTSWHLFAWPVDSEHVTYYRVLGQFESGERAPIRLEDGIGALRFDARYDPFLEMCFGRPHLRHPSPVANDARMCRAFLAASGAAYNRKARPGAKVTQIEIQAWSWDFRANPTDPQYGRLADRFVLDIEIPGSP